MKSPLIYLILAAVISSAVTEAQQSPSPAPQPASAQAQPAPCVPERPADPSKMVRIKPNSRWQIYLEKKRREIEQRAGITVPDQSLDELAVKAQTQAQRPCPVVPIPPAPQPVPVAAKQ